MGSRLVSVLSLVVTMLVRNFSRRINAVPKTLGLEKTQLLSPERSRPNQAQIYFGKTALLARLFEHSHIDLLQ